MGLILHKMQTKACAGTEETSSVSPMQITGIIQNINFNIYTFSFLKPKNWQENMNSHMHVNKIVTPLALLHFRKYRPFPPSTALGSSPIGVVSRAWGSHLESEFVQNTLLSLSKETRKPWERYREDTAEKEEGKEKGNTEASRSMKRKSVHFTYIQTRLNETPILYY